MAPETDKHKDAIMKFLCTGLRHLRSDVLATQNGVTKHGVIVSTQNGTISLQ